MEGDPGGGRGALGNGVGTWVQEAGPHEGEGGGTLGEGGGPWVRQG